MPKVFITYRQVDAAQLQRVRTFAENLRRYGIEIVLDQFYLDDNPGGPPEKWPKWSSDRAIETERVIIIGSEAWFLCFDGKQSPGTGLGAACEADDLRTRIYDGANINEDIRVVLFEETDAAHISFKLKGWHHFHAERDFASIVKWLGGTPLAASPVARTSIPNNLPRLPPFFGREAELKQIREVLDPASCSWGALIDGPAGMGKTSLTVHAAHTVPPGHFQRIIFVSLETARIERSSRTSGRGRCVFELAGDVE